MNEYDLVYDYRNEMASPYWIVPAVLGIILLYYLVIKKSSLFNQRLYAFLILACIGSVLGLYIFIRILIDTNSIKTMMNESKYSIVEGEIINYEIFAHKGKEESFTLDGYWFHYSRYERIFGYHNANPEKGPIIENGQYLRIGYYSKQEEGAVPRNYIVLIEILK